ncbi:hypothetical protein B7486_08225 [cyanobacterium TDX16]|nr:hypothetical protein B7486_08225 [cyanobacterium TDX16]
MTVVKPDGPHPSASYRVSSLTDCANQGQDRISDGGGQCGPGRYDFAKPIVGLVPVAVDVADV